MPQSQNINDMGFCDKCKMNVFPTRPKFNIKIFGFFVVVLFILLSLLTVISLSIFSSIFLFIFFMWGFMVINPYIIYYGLREKGYCPSVINRFMKKILSIYHLEIKYP